MVLALLGPVHRHCGFEGGSQCARYVVARLVGASVRSVGSVIRLGQLVSGVA